jgi:hypothetical protein
MARLVRWIYGICTVLLAGCVDGRQIIGPEDPSYEVICLDSIQTDTTVACWPVITITIIIENPNP